MPHRASRSSSSSGMASSVRISRAVAARQLVEPDVRALRDEDEPRHPGRVAGEPLRLGVEPGEVGRLAGAAARAAVAAATEPQMEPSLLLADDVEGEQHPVEEHVEGIPEQLAPVVADVPQLAGQRRRVGAGRRAEQLEQRRAVAADARQPCLVALDRGDGRIAPRGPERGVVDQHPQRSRGGVLVGDPDEQQLLEAGGGRARLDVRELGTDIVEQAARLGGTERGGDDVRCPVHAALGRQAPRRAPRPCGRSRGAARAPRARRPGRSARPARACR